jgi:hypothetical protein
MISLDVQGQLFKTDYDTIIKIPYFKNMFETCGTPSETIFVNRPPHIFKHILSLMVDNFYPYPEKYKFELDFYDIDYSNLKLYNPSPKNCIVNGCMHNVIDNSKLCRNHSICFAHGCNNIQTTYDNIQLKYCDKHIKISGCGMFNCPQKFQIEGYNICDDCKDINKL